jgi:hypothetical protein
MKKDRYYRTSNFKIARFLYAKGFVLTNIDKITNSKKAIFVFVESPEIGELLEIFNFGEENAPEVMVDARKLIRAEEELKDKLYQ